MECGTDWSCLWASVDGGIRHTWSRPRERMEPTSRHLEEVGCGVVERVGLVWRGCPRQGLLPRGEASTDHPLTTPHSSILPALSPLLASPRNKESSPSPFISTSCDNNMTTPWPSFDSIKTNAFQKTQGHRRIGIGPCPCQHSLFLLEKNV